MGTLLVTVQSPSGIYQFKAKNVSLCRTGCLNAVQHRDVRERSSVNDHFLTLK